MESRKKSILVTQNVNQQLVASRYIGKNGKTQGASENSTGNITAAQRIGPLGTMFVSGKGTH